AFVPVDPNLTDTALSRLSNFSILDWNVKLFDSLVVVSLGLAKEIGRRCGIVQFLSIEITLRPKPNPHLFFAVEAMPEFPIAFRAVSVLRLLHFSMTQIQSTANSKLPR